MKSFEVSNAKVAHDGGRAEPSQGGSRHPYFLFSGVVTLEFKEKRDIRVWAGDDQKTIEGFVIFNMNMQGVASLPSGLSESFTYVAETDGNGFTVKPASTDMTQIKRLYVPVGNDYPYPTVYAWGKGHEKCSCPFKSDSTDHLFGRPQLADDLHTWLLPGWGTDWSRERGSFQYRYADRVRAYYHPSHGVRRSETPVTGDGWKLLPVTIGMDYHSKESKRALVFHQTSWWNVNTSLESAQGLSQILRENKAATENWYAS